MPNPNTMWKKLTLLSKGKPNRHFDSDTRDVVRKIFNTRRPKRFALVKIWVVLCISLTATSVFSNLNFTEDYTRKLNSIINKIERQKVKYPNESYYVVSNLIQPRIQNNTSGNFDVVICTQTSLGNLHSIVSLARKWDGFISLAVFSFGNEISLTLYNIILLQKCSTDVRRKVSFHLVYPISKLPKHLTSLYEMDFDCHHLPFLLLSLARESYDMKHISYPVNLLRNVALLHSSSRYVFNIDIDLVPSKGLRKEMEAFLRRTTSEKQKKLAYVIPCFESNVTFTDPLSKAQLVSAVKNGTVRQFTFKKCFDCHVATNYMKWVSLKYPSKMNASYKVKFQIPYEPFYIADRKQMPLFDERFKQYGFNRVSQICEAYYSGYDFVVMNNAFVIHEGFKDPKNHYEWKEDENRKNHRFFNMAFKRDLKIKYPRSKRAC